MRAARKGRKEERRLLVRLKVAITDLNTAAEDGTLGPYQEEGKNRDPRWTALQEAPHANRGHRKRNG